MFASGLNIIPNILLSLKKFVRLQVPNCILELARYINCASFPFRRNGKLFFMTLCLPKCSPFHSYSLSDLLFVDGVKTNWLYYMHIRLIFQAFCFRSLFVVLPADQKYCLYSIFFFFLNLLAGSKQFLDH